MKGSRLPWLYLFYIWCTYYQYTSIQVLCVQPIIAQSKPANNFQIVGILPNSLYDNSTFQQCSLYSLRDIQLTQAMIYAIKTLVNNNSTLLPDINLGWTIIDSCSSRELAISNLASLLLYNQQQASISKSCYHHLKTTIDYNEHPHASNSTTTKFNQPPIIGIISGNSHLIAKALASFTSSLRYSHIDYYSFDSIFSDRQHFPYYYRTSSLANNQAQSIFNLFESFHWNQMPVVLAGNAEITRFLPLIINLQQVYNICFDPVIKLYDNYTAADLVDIIMLWKNRTRPHVVVILGHETVIFNLLKQAEIQDVTGITFLGGYGWLTSPRIHTIRADIIGGAIGITYRSNLLKYFSNYLNQLDFCNNHDNPWFKMAWHQKLLQAGLDVETILQNCTIDSKLKQQYFNEFYNIDIKSALITDSILAYSHALHKTLSCNNITCAYQSTNNFNRNNFNTILSKIKFAGVTNSDVTFDSDGSMELSFDFINLQIDTSTLQRQVKPVKIGYWSKASGLIIEKNKMIWNGNRSWYNVPQSRCSQDCPAGYYQYTDRTTAIHLYSCCWKCRRCPSHQISNTTNSRQCTSCSSLSAPNANSTSCVDFPIAYVETDSPLFIIICMVASLYFICLMSIWIVVIIKRNTPIVKGSNFILVNVLLFFIGMCIPTAILYLLPTTTATCQARMFTSIMTQVGICLTILCKTNQVSLIFKSAMTRRMKLTYCAKSINQVALIFIVLAVICCILICLTIFKPIKVIREATILRQIQLICYVPNNYHTINSTIWLGAIGLSCLIFAFKARSLPENFNESRYIFLSTLFICIIICSNYPATVALSGVIADSITSLIVLVFGMSPLLCIFLPKLYIIYHRPELNTKQEAMASITNFTFNSMNNNNKWYTASNMSNTTMQATIRNDQLSSINQVHPHASN